MPSKSLSNIQTYRELQRNPKLPSIGTPRLHGPTDDFASILSAIRKPACEDKEHVHVHMYNLWKKDIRDHYTQPPTLFYSTELRSLKNAYKTPVCDRVT